MEQQQPRKVLSGIIHSTLVSSTHDESIIVVSLADGTIWKKNMSLSGWWEYVGKIDAPIIEMSAISNLRGITLTILCEKDILYILDKQKFKNVN